MHRDRVSASMIVLFFFKQKTAYEMRISDWSSDVCSSDLMAAALRSAAAHELNVTGVAHAPAFGENYVQEALAKQVALTSETLEWHLIGHLQSNKAREAAAAFDWVQTVDRDKLVAALARHPPDNMPPPNVLVQVNIDAEAGKPGWTPGPVSALAAEVAATPEPENEGGGQGVA